MAKDDVVYWSWLVVGWMTEAKKEQCLLHTIITYSNHCIEVASVSRSFMENKAYFKYWGKARKEGDEGAPYHLLPYHCLDVAAVADEWWNSSQALQRLFVESSGLNDVQVKAWLLFFIALHDYGKLDMRFQLKASKVVEAVYPDFDPELVAIGGLEKQKYFHGPFGFSLFYFDFQPVFGWSPDDERWLLWEQWLAAVAGHHGVIPQHPTSAMLLNDGLADSSIIEHDQISRKAWVTELASLFLNPAGLSLQDQPPVFNPLVAGFCSVADWLGSNSDDGGFEFQAYEQDLKAYYEQRLLIAAKLLVESGLVAAKKAYDGVASLLPKDLDVVPRQLQLLVDQLPCEQGLTLIEAPTGSGKTETALAYAWRLLDAGLADSIIFALPTQATANAMLKRLEDVAPLLFQHHANLVLAHGKSRFNDDFWKIKEHYQANTPQGEEEAKVQCAQWLSSSRKRVFLGQIGVCTIDQVLISVLPVRHKFVRGFGVGKSILIVDEVHAYDSYMYGLLGEVLRQQQLMGGSALLLSATLPYHQRASLAKTWGGDLPEIESESYPLVTHINHQSEVTPFVLHNEDLPEVRTVAVEVLAKSALLADDDLVEQMLQAAEQGAQVVFICNLVDVAQATAKRLRQQNRVDIDLFHARYRFCDRQTIERKVLEKYGKDGARKEGSILVATQVVEQSLDLDFDWMITQLCPVDLLFQRLGRLHRHNRPRPAGFEEPRCSVLIPDDDDYGYHGLIYGNTRVLWRTAQKLIRAEGKIVFPDAYREWIEKVYQEDEWGDEPEAVLKSFAEFQKDAEGAFHAARMMMRGDISEIEDSDSKVSTLTRDGEMSLNVLPVIETSKGYILLEGDTPLNDLEDWWKDEALNLNMVAVPLKSWRKFFDVGDGLALLSLVKNGEAWQGEFKGITIRYSKVYGLEKEVPHVAD